MDNKDWTGTSVPTTVGCSGYYNTPHTRVKHSVELRSSYLVVSPLTSPNCVSVPLLKAYLSRVMIFRTVKYLR